MSKYCRGFTKSSRRVNWELRMSSVKCPANQTNHTKINQSPIVRLVCDQCSVIEHNSIPASWRVRLIIDSITETNMDLIRFVFVRKNTTPKYLTCCIRLEPNRDLYPSCNLFLQPEKSQTIENTCRMICSCVPVSVDVCHTLHTLNLS